MHNTGPSQNTRAQKKKLEEILTETPDNDEFDDQLLCFELMTSLNSDEDVVKVMGADVPLAVQIQAFPKLAGLFKMERKAVQDKKDWAEAMALKAERDRKSKKWVDNPKQVLPGRGHCCCPSCKSSLLPTRPHTLPPDRRCNAAVFAKITHQTNT